MIDEPHVVATVEDTGTQVVRECSCGWVTFGDIPEPAHHTPLAEREQEHLNEMAALADGTVWNEVPASHSYELILRRRLRDKTPNHVAIWAIWLGGFREVELWRWDAAGLAEAQQWCDQHYVIWRSSGSPVQPGELLRHIP